MATPSQGLFTASLPELYERFLVEPLFRPFGEALLDRAALTDSDRLLDVACGTGIVARIAHQRSGGRPRVVAVDASPGMLAAGRSATAGAIDFREGDATRLPIGDDERFDLVTCHQGLQFFPDKPAAVREMRRVLATSGRVAIGVWRTIDDTPMMRELHRVAERHLGPIADVRHSFGDAEALRRLLGDAGFSSIQIDTVTLPVRMRDDVSIFPRLNTMAIVGMSPAAKAMSDGQRADTVAAIVDDSIRAVQPFVNGTDLVFDLLSNVAVARG
jgi:ubiquinone/menaquinone biosynthesis C-methylase UbiE